MPLTSFTAQGYLYSLSPTERKALETYKNDALAAGLIPLLLVSVFSSWRKDKTLWGLSKSANRLHQASVVFHYLTQLIIHTCISFPSTWFQAPASHSFLTRLFPCIMSDFLCFRDYLPVAQHACSLPILFIWSLILDPLPSVPDHVFLPVSELLNVWMPRHDIVGMKSAVWGMRKTHSNSTTWHAMRLAPEVVIHWSENDTIVACVARRILHVLPAMP